MFLRQTACHRGWSPCQICCQACPQSRGVLKGLDFFLLRTALRDRPKGPSTANHQPPQTANRHQPPTANRRQPPAATNRQPPTTAKRHQPPITNHQPPTTTTNRHEPPVPNRQPPTAHRQHMVCLQAFLGKLCKGTLFFSVKDCPAKAAKPRAKASKCAAKPAAQVAAKPTAKAAAGEPNPGASIEHVQLFKVKYLRQKKVAH